jgi:unsaturated chondroitin disaccharide hydrolase
LAWAIYGFTAACHSVRDARFLRTAELCADFYIRQTPADGVPFFDYDTPADGPRHKDSSAAAITAAALLRLARLTPDAAKSVLYEQTAHRILLTLSGPPYLAAGVQGWEGILREGVYHLHKGLGVGESVMWGEYFFVEALERALRLTEQA